MIVRTQYLEKLKTYTGKPLIKVISGMRRVGKSTLLKEYRDFLTHSGVPEQNILLINMELLEFDSIRDYTDLNAHIRQTVSQQTGTKYLLIDEIQDINQWEKAINSFFAEGGYDITITGSNARMLSAELSTLLAGRYIEITLYPFSFRDFRDYRLQQVPGETVNISFKQFLRYGGLPGIHALPFSDDVIFPYLNAIYNTVLLKDVITRNKIRDVEQLERITRFVFNNCGNITSAKNIADYLKSQRARISVETVQNYLFFLTQSFMIHKVRRYDLKGKKLLEYSEKYYPADIGLRFGLAGYSESDISGLLESIVFIELLQRGYTVYVGQSGSYEIDFIAEKQEKRIYIQVAYLLGNEKTIEREFGNLERIGDSFPKMVLSMDEFWPQNRNGIIRKNIIEFLLEN
ncbi:MAG: ATP-binding protein [Bacteroidales bacterium]|nr:ATP-binding protein [Bacteroidales bacterium]